MIKEKVISNKKLFEVGVACQVPHGVNEVFPIRIIVFDELQLIVHVIQGLSLSTASLVSLYNDEELRITTWLQIDRQT